MAREIKDMQIGPEEAETQVKQERPIIDENSLQILLTELQEKELTDIVIQDFDTAVEARNASTGNWGISPTSKQAQTFEQKLEMLINLYEAQHPPRKEEWMCNTDLRITMAIVEMLHAQLFPAIWNKDLLNYKPVEQTDSGTKERIGKLMDWIVNVPLKFKPIVDDSVKSVIKLGTIILGDEWLVEFKDKGEKEPVTVSDEETGEEVQVVDENEQPLMRNVLDRQERAKSRLVPLDRFYIQPGATDIQKEPIIERLNFFYSDLEQLEVEGKVKNINVDLKLSVDTIIVTEVDEALEEAEKVAKVNVKRRNYPCDVLKWCGPYDANNDGFPEEIVALVERRTRTLIGAIPLNKISRRVERPYVAIQFIRREGKFYGIGVIEQVYSLATEINTVFRQLTDANTLSIMRWGFFDPNSQYNPAVHIAKPRAMYPVSDPKRSVYFPDIAIPIERLINAIRLLLEFVERLTAASSYVMGKEGNIVGGPGTATRTNAIMQSAAQRFQIPVTRIKDGIAEHLTHILSQYQMNMPDGLEKRVLGEDGQPLFEKGSLLRKNIDSEMDVYLDPDFTLGNKDLQKEIANYLYSTLLGNPIIMSDPAKIYLVTADMLKTLGKVPEEYLGPAPSLKDFDSPEDENTLIREGRFREVVPSLIENHIEHMQVHSAPLQGPEATLWDPKALEYLQAHIQAHTQMMQQMIQIQQQSALTGQPQPGQQPKPQHATTGLNRGGTPNPLENQPKPQQAQAAGVAQ